MLDGIDWGILIWLVVAALSGLGEMLTGTFLLVPFAIAALGAAILVALGVDITWVLFVFGVVALVVLRWGIQYGRRVDAEPPATRAGAGRYVGAEGSVIRRIDPMTAGMVRLGTEDWRALSDSGDSIEVGVRVRALSLRGNALVVEALPENGG